MQWSDISFTPENRTLRQFAALWIAVFGAMAIWQGLARSHPLAGAILGLAATTIGPLGLVKPQCIRPIYVGWMIVAFPIGWIVSTVLLALLYFGVFTPVGLIFRMTGRDALSLRRPTDRRSYWSEKPAPANARNYFQQF
jgi:hypothetical protein